MILGQQPLPATPQSGGSVPATSPLQSGPANGTTTTSGGATPGTPQQPPGPNLMFMFAVLIVAMLVFTMWSSRRDRKRKEALMSGIKKHDRVQTIGGVIGSVVEVKPDYIVLKVDESSNTRITFARSAVQQVLTSSPEPVGQSSDDS